MDLKITGRCAAVAAASQGLGFGTARALAAEGVRVASCGRNRGKVEKAAASLGPDAVPLVVDVSNAEGAGEFVAQAREALGGLDILVTNAGGPPPGNFEQTPLEAYPDAISLNLMSVVAMTPLSNSSTKTAVTLSPASAMAGSTREAPVAKTELTKLQTR